MKLLFILLALLAATGCFEQPKIPTVVQDAFAKSFPGIAIKKWNKEDGNYEVNFITNGKTMSATFTATGILEETETDIEVSELPSSVNDYIKLNYKGAVIKEAAMIVKDNDKMYEAEVKGKDLLFDMNGKFLKEEED